MKEISVLVVYYGNKQTFIQRDIDILSKHFKVDKIELLRFADIFQLARKIRRNDVVYIWFAGKHAGISVLLSKLFRKKSIVVVGGYDAAYKPGIGYGLWAVGSFWDKLLAKYALKNATIVMAVDKSLIKNLKKYASIQREIKVVPTGYDPDFWKMPENGKKENLVLTVAYIDSWKRVKVKGIDRFIEVANKLPDLKFRIVGVTKEFQGEIKEMVKSENVEIYPPEPPEKLLIHYQQAKVYCQFSRSEGLPNTLCEAMLCECVPVVTDVGGMCEAVETVGYCIRKYNIDKVTNIIKSGLKEETIIRKEVRNKIIKNFPIHKREETLQKILSNIFKI